jgi:hypothetical protein
VTKKPAIPHREPEVIEAEARRHWRGNHDKVSTTTLNDLFIGKTRIWSRYQKAHEMELMRDAFLAIEASDREHVVEIYCDSKMSNSYTIVLRIDAKMFVHNFMEQIRRRTLGDFYYQVELLDGTVLYSELGSGDLGK